jgi:hypothetical protein
LLFSLFSSKRYNNNKARELEESDTAAMECLLTTVKRLLPSDKLSLRSSLRRSKVKNRSSTVTKDTNDGDGKDGVRNSTRKSTITFAVDEDQPTTTTTTAATATTGTSNGTSLAVTAPQSVGTGVVGAGGDASKKKGGEEEKRRESDKKKKRVSLDVLEQPKPKKEETSGSVVVVSPVAGGLGFEEDEEEVKGGEKDLLTLQATLVSLGLIDGTFFKHCDDWFEHLAGKVFDFSLLSLFSHISPFFFYISVYESSPFLLFPLSLSYIYTYVSC